MPFEQRALAFEDVENVAHETDRTTACARALRHRKRVQASGTRPIGRFRLRGRESVPQKGRPRSRSGPGSSGSRWF